MVLERRGDCSLILARVYSVEREKRIREEEKKKKEEGRREEEEILVWKYGIHVWNISFVWNS